MSKEQFNEMLTHGKGPEIRVLPLELENAIGETPPPTDGDGNQLSQYTNDDQKLIFLNKDLVEMMEIEYGKITQNSGWQDIMPSKKWKDIHTKGVIMTVFHEAVHYGRYISGKGNTRRELRAQGVVDKNGNAVEPGNKFEEKANDNGEDTPQYKVNDKGNGYERKK